LLEVGQEDAVDAPRQEAGKISLAHAERQPAHVLAVTHEDVEGVKLDLMIVPAAVQAIEVAAPVDAKQHSLGRTSCTGCAPRPR
jgi:hypothetical protein